ncbi:hypothetical protein [Rheinheimera sp. WS51]|uniref:hypothetical protein n=1 Tax=Rheinheimera sp. WS51 TaxID=3425886 RepID=UPI003D8E7ABB
MLIRHRFIYALILFSSIVCQVVADEADVDPELEQQLDHYIELTQTDFNAGLELIEQLTASSLNISALQSRARLLGYLVTNTYHAEDFEQSEQLLQQLLQIAELTDDPNTLSEIYATELELLLFDLKLDQAIIKLERLESKLAQATEPRILYFSHNVIGRVYKTDGQYSEALQHFIKALDALELTDDKNSPVRLRRQAFLNFNIATAHAEL